MSYHFRNLVFEGGGVKGIAYVGALSVLQDKDILQDIVRVGGTSAGAIIALLLALEFSIEEIKDILFSLDFNRFMDASWGVIRNTERLIKEFGWYKGDYFKNWIGVLIEKKTGSKLTTFKELYNMKLSRELYLVGTNLSTGYAEIFSSKHSPDMSLVEAVRISMSIPIFFTAVRTSSNEICVDGGILDNYPIKLFDKRNYIDNHFVRTNYYEEINKRYMLTEKDHYVFNMETLGFRLDTKKEILVFEKIKQPEVEEIKDFYQYIKRLIGTCLDGQQNRHLHSDDWQRTVYIDSLAVRTTDFDISDTKKQALVNSGKEGMEQYLNWFDNTRDRPINKPVFMPDRID